MFRRGLLFVCGGLYAIVASAWAMILGGGLGHGTDYFARVPLSPFSIPESAFEHGSLLPALGVLAWAVAFASVAERSSGGSWIALVWFGIHILTAGTLLLDTPSHPLLPWLFVPYGLGLLVFLVLTVRAIRRQT